MCAQGRQGLGWVSQQWEAQFYFIMTFILVSQIYIQPQDSHKAMGNSQPFPQEKETEILRFSSFIQYAAKYSHLSALTHYSTHVTLISCCKQLMKEFKPLAFTRESQLLCMHYLSNLQPSLCCFYLKNFCCHQIEKIQTCMFCQYKCTKI